MSSWQGVSGLMTTNLAYQLEIPRKKGLGTVHETVLWACLWGIFLIATWCRRAKTLCVGLGRQACAAEEESQEAAFLHVFCLGPRFRLLPELPPVTYLSWEPNKTFPSPSYFRSVFYQSNGDLTRTKDKEKLPMLDINQMNSWQPRSLQKTLEGTLYIEEKKKHQQSH